MRVSIIYRFYRRLVRIWLSLSLRKIRLLHAKGVAVTNPSILAVSRPPGFLDALVLVAAFESPVRCLIDRRLLRGRWRNRLAKGLGMVAYDAHADRSESALNSCREALARREAVAVFADQRKDSAGDAGLLSLKGAAIGLEVEASHGARLGLKIFPVHVYLPEPRSRSKDVLLYVEPPIFAQEYLTAEGAASLAGTRALATLIDRSWQDNAFRIQRSALEHFLSDLEDVFRVDLAETWAARPNWKQSVEGFELSRLVTEWVERMNTLDPARLVDLRQALEGFRERLRRFRLREFQVETGGRWIKSGFLRALVWMETVAGLPIAAYGLVNHLLALLLLRLTGLLNEKARGSSKTLWLLRALVVFASYFPQILLFAFWRSWSQAEIYAAALPLSGAYLWRYTWLLRNRTRLVVALLRIPQQALEMRGRRTELLGELDLELSAFAELRGLAH